MPQSSAQVHSPSMATTGEGPLIVLPEWESSLLSLKDFSLKRPVPTMAKVVKGHYMNIGVSKFSLQRLHQEVFIHSVKMSVKVFAHSVRRIEVTQRRGYPYNIRLMSLEQRLAIPIAYQGWFELLSEDGKSARPIASVHELARVYPSRVLVRDNIKAYLPNDTGSLTFDKTKIVPAGEQLTLGGEVSLPSSTPNGKVKLLRCRDSKGETLFLSFDQKGFFTPIAGANDFTGVFNIRDIVRRFRLPLTVRLVQGVRPKVDADKFTGVIRLDWVYTDETVFMCPIEKNHIRILPVPTDVNLQLHAASNHKTVIESEHFKTLATKCNRMVANYFNTIHLIVTVPESVVKSKNRQSANIFSTPQFSDTDSRPIMRRSKSREDILMDEIEDVYQYVRDGVAPPDANIKFSYDSDEESYWEEPAYEPIDDFRARLNALNAGQKVSYPDKYRPADIAKLNLNGDFDVGASGMESTQTYGGTAEDPPITFSPGDPPTLPPRDSPANSSSSSGQATPPPLPPRRYQRSDSAPTINPKGQQAQNRRSVQLPKHKWLKKSKSRESMGMDSSGSSGDHRRTLGKDFHDSDISSRAKGSSSSGAQPVRRRMQMLYL